MTAEPPSVPPEIATIQARNAVAMEQVRFDQRMSSLACNLEAMRLARLELGYSPNEIDFFEVRSGDVPEDVVRAAQAVVSACMLELRLPARPQLQWFLPETAAHSAYRRKWGAPDWSGFLDGETTVGRAERAANLIWVRADLPLGQTMRTVAHEMRHCTQSAPDSVESYLANEADARAYEQAFAAAYLTNN